MIEITVPIRIIKENQKEIERYYKEILKYRTNKGYPDKIIENKKK